MKKDIKRKVLILLIAVSALLAWYGLNSYSAYATDTVIPEVDVTFGAADSPTDVTNSMKILFLLTIISLAPSILIMMTSFTRIVIVLHFLRSALGTQQTPPNQIIIGLALFLTLFIMSPVLNDINENAIKPYNAGTITQAQAIDEGMKPLKSFMLKQTYEKDLNLFINISKTAKVESPDKLPATVIIPAFIISELKKGFMMGFIIYIPFLVIDMIVSSTLMAMGMMMLPPVMISLPFKLLLFVMVDGWNLLVGQIVQSFR